MKANCMNIIINHGTFKMHYTKKDLFFHTGRLREIKTITTKFAADSVAICAYGLRQNSFLNSDTEFRKYGRKFLEPTLWRGIEQTFVILAPRLADFLRFK
jgi:hypothetical protein